MDAIERKLMKKGRKLSRDKKRKDGLRKIICERKATHETYGNAHAFKMSFHPDDPTIRVYHCRFCHKYHLGHPDENKQRHIELKKAFWDTTHE